MENSWVPFVLQCILYKILHSLNIFTEFAQIENGYKLQPGLARWQFPSPTARGQRYDCFVFTSALKSLPSGDLDGVYKKRLNVINSFLSCTRDRYQLSQFMSCSLKKDSESKRNTLQSKRHTYPLAHLLRWFGFGFGWSRKEAGRRVGWGGVGNRTP